MDRDRAHAQRPPDGLRIAGWQVHPSALRIVRHDIEVRLQPKVMQLLLHLTREPGETISRRELEEALWPDVNVGYDALATTVSKLRDAFGDRAKPSQVIETIPKIGYRLIAPVENGATNVHPRPAKRPATDNVPTIAVLPFGNLTGDPAQEYWIDGFTEDLITTLSKIPLLFVIAHNSTFAYKDKPTRLHETSEALGVRYILEGSAQLVGMRMRINAQLIDMRSGRYLWSERYDREFNDILALHDDIGRRIVTELEVKLTMGEDARIYRQGTDSAAAYLHVLRGRELFQHFDRTDNQAARREFEQALELDPYYANAASWLGWTYWNEARYTWSADRGESLRVAEAFARRSLTLDGEWGTGYGPLGAVFLLRGDFDRSLAARKRALEISPGRAENQYMMGWTLVYSGNPDQAIEHLRRALRLSPLAPPHWASSLGEAYRLSGRADEAVQVLRAVVERAPEDINVGLIRLAAALVAAGKEDEAREVTAQIMRIRPTFSLAAYAKSRIYRDPKVTERLIADLRKLGLPQ